MPVRAGLEQGQRRSSPRPADPEERPPWAVFRQACARARCPVVTNSGVALTASDPVLFHSARRRLPGFVETSTRCGSVRRSRRGRRGNAGFRGTAALAADAVARSREAVAYRADGTGRLGCRRWTAAQPVPAEMTPSRAGLPAVGSSRVDVFQGTPSTVVRRLLAQSANRRRVVGERRCREPQIAPAW